MVKFDDVLQLKQGDQVVIDATGPLNTSDEELVELCAWVFQRGPEDAGATEMTTGEHHATAGGHHLEFFTDPDGQEHWKLPLRLVGKAPLKEGPAFGVAVAMMKMKKESNEQRVVWWGHPVELIAAPAGS